MTAILYNILPYVMEQVGWSQTQASMCFYLALSTFVFGNIVGGRLQDSYHPGNVVFGTGIIFALIALVCVSVLGYKLKKEKSSN